MIFTLSQTTMSKMWSKWARTKKADRSKNKKKSPKKSQILLSLFYVDRMSCNFFCNILGIHVINPENMNRIGPRNNFIQNRANVKAYDQGDSSLIFVEILCRILLSQRIEQMNFTKSHWKLVDIASFKRHKNGKVALLHLYELGCFQTLLSGSEIEWKNKCWEFFLIFSNSLKNGPCFALLYLKVI